MPSSTPHQKFSFYHLPTQGRAWIKLGEAWYVSNVSIIFYCSMLYYILFWTLLGFIIHFYIIFGTNLLTTGPVQIAVILPISMFRRKGISNGMKPLGELFLEQTWSRRLGVDAKKEARRPRGREVRPHPRGPLVAPPTYFLRLYILLYPENIQEHHGTLFPPPQPSVPVRSHLGAFFGALPEGESIMEGFYINTIASLMMCE